MKNIRIALFCMLLSITGLHAQNEIGLKLQYGLGYDLQVLSDYPNSKGPLYLPGGEIYSKIILDEPQAASLHLSYGINNYIDLYVDYTRINRNMRYLDYIYHEAVYVEEELEIGLNYNNLGMGIQFRSNMDSRVNFYWEQGVGMRFGNGKFPEHNFENPTLNVVLHSSLDGTSYMLGLDLRKPVILIITGIGAEYNFWREVSLVFNVRYVYERKGEDQLAFWQFYEGERGFQVGSTRNLKFNSLFFSMGLKYDL